MARKEDQVKAKKRGQKRKHTAEEHNECMLLTAVEARIKKADGWDDKNEQTFSDDAPTSSLQLRGARCDGGSP